MPLLVLKNLRVIDRRLPPWEKKGLIGLRRSAYMRIPSIYIAQFYSFLHLINQLDKEKLRVSHCDFKWIIACHQGKFILSGLGP
ncbi:hypothetical protein EBX31_00230 [bacterium]|nr:hypothetical protein [bacterium]